MAAVTIEFIAEISKATKDISNFASSIDNQFKGITTAAKTLSAAFLGIGAALGVGFSLKKAIDEAAEFEEKVNEIAIALRLSGIEGQAAVDSFVEFSGEIQRTTRLTDEAVLSSGALIQNLARLSEDGLKQATQAAIDLSAALKIDLNTASQLVGKAAEGNITAFKRFGLEIQKGKNDAETFSNTLKTISDRFGGSAVAATNTFSGAIDQLRNNFNDVVKNFGLGIIQNDEFIASIKQLSQVLISLVPIAARIGVAFGETIAGAIDVLKTAIDNLPAVFASLTTFIVGVSIPAIIASFGTLTTVAAPALVLAFETIAGAAATAWAAITGPVGLVVTAVGAVSIAVGLLVKKFSDAKKASEALADQNDKIAKSLNNIDEQRSEQRRAQKESGSLFAAPRVDLEALNKARDDFKKFFKDIEKTSASELDKIKLEEKEKFLALDEFRKKGVVSVKQYSESYANILNESNTKQLAALEAQKKKEQDALKAKIEPIANLGSNILSSVRQGAEGAASALANVGGFIVDTIIPGLGGVASQLLSFLAQGPEAVKAQIEAFIENIPIIIEAIVESIPVFFDRVVATATVLIT